MTLKIDKSNEGGIYMVIYSDLYKQYVVIYQNSDTGKNTISKFDTPEMANGFLDSLTSESKESFWWERS